MSATIMKWVLILCRLCSKILLHSVTIVESMFQQLCWDMQLANMYSLNVEIGSFDSVVFIETVRINYAISKKIKVLFKLYLLDNIIYNATISYTTTRAVRNAPIKNKIKLIALRV